MYATVSVIGLLDTHEKEVCNFVNVVDLRFQFPFDGIDVTSKINPTNQSKSWIFWELCIFDTQRTIRQTGDFVECIFVRILQKFVAERIARNSRCPKNECVFLRFHWEDKDANGSRWRLYIQRTQLLRSFNSQKLDVT
jgi:hypothetical protein